MMVKNPPPNSCFSLFVNNRLFLLFLYFSKWILVPDPARLMQIYSAFKLINDTLQFNDYSLLSLKGFQMQVLLFALCCDIRSWIGIIPRCKSWKSLISRDFYIYACIIFVVLSLSLPQLITAYFGITSRRNTYEEDVSLPWWPTFSTAADKS